MCYSDCVWVNPNEVINFPSFFSFVDLSLWCSNAPRMRAVFPLCFLVLIAVSLLSAKHFICTNFYLRITRKHFWRDYHNFVHLVLVSRPKSMALTIKITRIHTHKSYHKLLSNIYVNVFYLRQFIAVAS